MLFAQITKTYRELPSNVRIFAIRGLLLLTGWLLLYYLLLKPANVPDAQLTHMTQVCTAWMLGLIYSDVHLITPDIFVAGKDILCITNPCNGLELFVLYLAFLICIPSGSKKRFFAFAVGGTIAIFILNIVRCTALGVMSYHHSTLTDFAHHYAFKLFIYAVAFLGWILYSKKEKTDAA